MPGYIMHLAEGRLLEEALCDRGFLKGERDLSLFQDGLLLPDTKRKKEKILYSMGRFVCHRTCSGVCGLVFL